VIAVDANLGRVASTLPTTHRAHKPDISLSPDGQRLYVAYSSPFTPHNHLEGLLEVFDTLSGKSVHLTPKPDRSLSTLPAYNSKMAVSADGRWLFQMKMRTSDTGYTSYYVDTFDTATLKLLPETAPVPMCVSGLIVPSRLQRQQLSVVCSHTQDVRLLTLTEAGGLAKEPTTVATADSRWHEHPGTAFATSEGQLTAISGSGHYVTVDAVMQRILRRDSIDRVARRVPVPDQTRPPVRPPPASPDPDDWLADRRIRLQPAIFARDAKELYLGLGIRNAVGTRTGQAGLYDVVVLSTESLNRLRTIRLSRPVFSIALSRDRQRLFGVDPWDGGLLVIDAATGKEIRVIAGIGATPTLAIAGR
jgi:hypothetical protein